MTGVLVLSVVEIMERKLKPEFVQGSEGHVRSELPQLVDQCPPVVVVLADLHLGSRDEVGGADVKLSSTVELLLLTVGAPLHLPVSLPDDTPHHLLKLLVLVTVPVTNICYRSRNIIKKYLPL